MKEAVVLPLPIKVAAQGIVVDLTPWAVWRVTVTESAPG
jgi:hypothetical protein